MHEVKSPVEVEVKLGINWHTLSRLEKKLNRRLGKDTPWVVQENIIYKAKEGFVRFRREGDKVTLTVKGKNSFGKYNERSENECQIAESFFEGLLQNAKSSGAIVYEKKRATYFEGNCIICLDDLDGWYFIEIEGEKKYIDRNISRLGLDGIITEKRDYAELVEAKKEKR